MTSLDCEDGCYRILSELFRKRESLTPEHESAETSFEVRQVKQKTGELRVAVSQRMVVSGSSTIDYIATVLMKGLIAGQIDGGTLHMTAPEIREPQNKINQQRAQIEGQAYHPEVGIFWELDGKLIIDGVLLDIAESYGRFLNYPRGHDELWSTYQLINVVPRDVEYHQAPRGRVVYDTVSQQFLLYVDACILRNKTLVNQILRQLKLPSNVSARLDEHYRCPKCLRRAK
jgi:hypothetical protein